MLLNAFFDLVMRNPAAREHAHLVPWKEHQVATEHAADRPRRADRWNG
jgi:hypothetical protein